MCDLPYYLFVSLKYQLDAKTHQNKLNESVTVSVTYFEGNCK